MMHSKKCDKLLFEIADKIKGISGNCNNSNASNKRKPTRKEIKAQKRLKKKVIECTNNMELLLEELNKRKDKRTNKEIMIDIINKLDKLPAKR